MPANACYADAMPAEPSLLADLATLTKVRISAASSFTAAAGYIAFARMVRPDLAFLLLGTVLLAMGSSALNEVQERVHDARMPRTARRPIPRGAFTPGAAATLAFALAAAGFGTLYLSHGWPTALLGLLALGWYNGLYTPLKRITAFAVVPGSLIGSLPPAMGWVAAGGNLSDPPFLALGFVLFIWQVPHFWLLQALHAEGYSEGGFPTLKDQLSPDQVHRLIFTWMAATAASTGLLVAFRTVSSTPALVMGCAAALWLVVRGIRFLRAPADTPGLYRRTFMDINVYALGLIVAACLDPWM